MCILETVKSTRVALCGRQVVYLLPFWTFPHPKRVADSSTWSCSTRGPVLLILGWDVTVTRDTVFIVLTSACPVGVWLWTVSSRNSAWESDGLLFWVSAGISLLLPKPMMDGHQVCVLVLLCTASSLTVRSSICPHSVQGCLLPPWTCLPRWHLLGCVPNTVWLWSL